MSRHLAIVDTETQTVFVEYPECIVEYDITMYAAALNNDKYWEDAEVRTLADTKIPELILENR